MPANLDADSILVIMSAILTLVAAWIGNFYNIIFLIFMIAAQAFMRLKPRTASLIIVGFVGIYFIEMWFLGIVIEGMFNLITSVSVGLVFVVSLSLVLTRYAEQTERAEKLAGDLQAANQELLEARRIEKQLAAAEERVRLARDIHDGLGHHLTALNIQLQAAEKMVALKPEKALEAIQICRQESKAALEEVRRSVAVMRRSPLDGKTLQEALSGLIKDFAKTFGNKVQIDLPEVYPDLNSQVAITIFRAVQEGLTNIQKHAANANNIKIDLKIPDSEINLIIQDDGSQALEDQSTSGFGLAGLQERAEQLGGSLRLSSRTEQGFILKLTLPIKGDGND